MKTVKVTSIPTTFTYGGKKYGPFRVTATQKHTEVPEALAIAAGLPQLPDDAPAESGKGSDTPALRTGALPGNIVGAAKLTAAGITTYEGLREATDEQLTAAELDAEQIKKLRDAQAQPAKA